MQQARELHCDRRRTGDGLASAKVRAERAGDRERVEPDVIPEAFVLDGDQCVDDIGVDAIVCCTRWGRTVRAMAGLRPGCRLVGASPEPATARQLALSWGVEPLVVGEYGSTDELVWCVVEATVEQGLVAHGDTVAVLAGAPDSPSHATDVLRIVTLT